MLKSKLVMLCVCAALGSAMAEVTIEQQKMLKAMRERPTLVSRDTTTLPGYIIEHWKNNEREYVTNKVFVVTGVEQPTSWSKVIASLEAEALPAKKIKQAKKKAEMNLDKILKALEQAMKKSSSDEEKEFYQAIVDLITEDAQ